MGKKEDQKPAERKDNETHAQLDFESIRKELFSKDSEEREKAYREYDAKHLGWPWNIK